MRYPETFDDRSNCDAGSKTMSSRVEMCYRGVSPFRSRLRESHVFTPALAPAASTDSRLTGRLKMSSCTSLNKVEGRLHHHCNHGTGQPTLSPPSLLVLSPRFMLLPYSDLLHRHLHDTRTLTMGRKRASHSDDYLILTTARFSTARYQRRSTPFIGNRHEASLP